MASVVAYRKSMLIERIKRHMNDGFTSSSFGASDREILLYIDEAVAFSLVGQAYEGAKVEGNLVVPEAYLTTYTLSLSQNVNTGEWYTTLPQPPVSLPLGYSINRVYFASTMDGISQEVLPISAKRRGYRNNMPRPSGAEYWVENSLLWVTANDGSPLFGLNLYVNMAKTRSDDINEVMALPDDAIEGIFNKVIVKMTSRLQVPKDIVNDNLPAGNKTS
jgi:hypothetical protein